MGTRGAPLVVAAVLGLLLVIGGAVAWSAAGRPAAGGPPQDSPPALPEAGAGASVVQLSADAAVHPDAAAVLAQLQRHYDAINDGDYATWAATVVPERAEALPEPDWQDAYATTTDGTIRIDRIDPGDGATVLVRVRFVSTQAVEDAPPDLPAQRLCWRSTLPMTASADGAPPRIALTGGGSSAAQIC